MLFNFPCAICQPMRTVVCTRWQLNAEMQRFKPRYNLPRSFKSTDIACFQNSRPDCKIESVYTNEKLTVLTLMDFAVTQTHFSRLYVASTIFENIRRFRLVSLIRHCERSKKEGNGLFRLVLLTRDSVLYH